MRRHTLRRGGWVGERSGGAATVDHAGHQAGGLGLDRHISRLSRLLASQRHALRLDRLGTGLNIGHRLGDHALELKVLRFRQQLLLLVLQHIQLVELARLDQLLLLGELGRMDDERPVIQQLAVIVSIPPLIFTISLLLSLS